jgi:short-subunit dehydrogenase
LGDSVLFDRAEWIWTRQILRTKILAVAQLTSALVPGMVERRRGGVLNIGSGAGLTVLPNAAAYVGSKHFVAGFSEALRADISGTGITVTQVCPGPVESEFDQVSGSPGGMVGAPRQFLRMSAAQCAREALAGFERGEARVFPGRAYRFVMGAAAVAVVAATQAGGPGSRPGVSNQQRDAAAAFTNPSGGVVAMWYI